MYHILLKGDNNISLLLWFHSGKATLKMHLTQGQNSSHSPISLSFWLANLKIPSYEGKDKTHTDVGLTDEDFP